VFFGRNIGRHMGWDNMGLSLGEGRNLLISHIFMTMELAVLLFLVFTVSVSCQIGDINLANVSADASRPADAPRASISKRGAIYVMANGRRSGFYGDKNGEGQEEERDGKGKGK